MRCRAYRPAYAYESQGSNFPAPVTPDTHATMEPATVDGPITGVRHRGSRDEFAIPGDPGLSRQERRLLKSVARHGVVKLAANELGISLNTAYSYLKSVRRKLGVTTTLEAVLLVYAPEIGVDGSA